MNKIIKMEYDTPETTIIILSENSVICASPAVLSLLSTTTGITEKYW